MTERPHREQDFGDEPAGPDEGDRVRVASVPGDTPDRGSTERQLRDREKLLAIAGRIARFGGWMADLAEGTIYLSDQVCAIHETPPGSSVSLEEGILLCAPQWRPVVREHFRACVEEGIPFDLELEVLTRSNRRLWIRTIGEPVRGEDGSIERVHGAYQDISPQKKAEAEIRHLENRLRRTVENITDAFFTLDREWRFTFLNQEAERILERPAEDLVGRVLWDAFPELVNGTFHREYRRAVDEDTVVRFEEYYPPLGRWFSVHAYPSQDGLAVYFRDVSDRRRAETALRESEERFRAVARATTDAVRDWDLRTDQVWWSEGMESLFGYAPHELEPDSRSWRERIHPEDRDRVIASVEEAIEGGGELWEQEYRFRKSDGSYARVQDGGFVIRDDDARAIRLVGGMSDVTERRELEEKLRQAQKMEAIGRLAGGVAHDFNNLLTVIQGQAQLVLEELPRGSELREDLGEILREAERAATLTRQLLAFSRRQILEERAFGLPTVVSEMLPMLRRLIPERIELEFEGSDGEMRIEADPTQLRQAIMNLVVNAADAIEDEGRIRLEVGARRLSRKEAEELPWNAEPGCYTVLTVRDDGVGMDRDVRERVFEPFFTTKPEGQGTGLGLSMVFGIVKQSRGHILIDSEPGKGTAVQVLLPLLEGEEPRAEVSEDAREARRPGVAGGTVLLVEDEAAVRNVAARVLERSGYSLMVATTGEEALEIARKRGAEIDLVISDIVMPQLGGSRLADRLRELHPHLPVVLMSGYAEGELSGGVREKAAAFLEKPFSPADLLETVREVLPE